jgi:hypothetical protein
MLDGSLQENFLRNVEILMKIVAPGNTAGAVEIMQTRIVGLNFPRLPRSEVQFNDSTVIDPETPQTFKACIESYPIQSERT